MAATLLAAASGCDGGYDKNGLYKVVKYNEQGYYDYYGIMTESQPQRGFWREAWQGKDCLPLKEVDWNLLDWADSSYLPTQVVTPDGLFHRAEDIGWFGSSQEIYNSLKELRSDLPVVASIVDIGASGGYMISCGAEHIMANSGSITGSIGVISQYYNLSELLKFIKLDIEVLKSGKFKDTSSITKALSAEEKELINNLLIDIHEQFKEIVKIERKLNAKEIEIVSKGQIFTGKQATVKPWSGNASRLCSFSICQ